MSKQSLGGSIPKGDPAPTDRPGASRMEEGEPPVKNERLDGEGVAGQPAPAPAPAPPEERPRPESGGGGDGGRRPSDPGGGPRAQGTSSPAVGEAGAAAGGGPRGSPEPEPAMGGCCSRSVTPEEEGVLHISAENKQPKSQNQEKDDQVSRLEQEVQRLNERVSHAEKDIQELKKNLGASGAQQTTTWFSGFRGPTVPAKDFFVQVQISGRTDGCEVKFLKDVSKHPSRQGVSIKVKEFRKISKDPLLLFCPIASRMRTDIDNALEGLCGERKVLLVVMHYVQKENPGTPGEVHQPVSLPDMVQAVHTRFTLQDGFYPCQMNETAVADVAAALKGLAEDH